MSQIEKPTIIDKIVIWFSKFWLNHFKPWWSRLRWYKHLEDESCAIPKVTRRTMESALKDIYAHYKWKADGFSELTDSYRPIPYIYNMYVAAKEEDGIFEDDCFTGDTRIISLDGNSYSFEELVNKNIQELWVYSCLPNGTIVPAKAVNPREKATTVPLVKITLDNGAEIKCTQDHLFMLRDGSYKKAIEIVPHEDSLMPGYLRVNKDGYTEVKDNLQGKYLLVHKIVNNFCHKDEKEKTRNKLRIDKWKNDVLVTHHVDHNKRNNTPNNLRWKTWREHATSHLIEYNKSDKHRETATKIAPSNGRKRLIQYNESVVHKQTVKKMNQEPFIKHLQKRGKTLKIMKKALEQNGEITEESYNQHWIPGAPKYKNLSKYFSSAEEMKELAASYNHKVVKVEFFDSTEPVYDITVEHTHNFLLDAGVFVHNCDGFHSVVYHLFQQNGYDCALITLVTKPFTKSHTMCAFRIKDAYYVVNYQRISGPYMSLQDFVDAYNDPVRYWNLQKYDYSTRKFYTVTDESF